MSRIRICSFNVNGVRARPHQLEFLADNRQLDIIGLQETKVADDIYPMDTAVQLGYEVLTYGQKAHHGVATMYKPSDELQLQEWHRGVPGLPDEKHPRIIRALFRWQDEPLWVINGYFPQGENRSHAEKFPYKQQVYRKLTDFLNETHSCDEQLIVMGDLNISPEDRDIGIGEENRKRWLRDGKCSFLPEEREMLAELCDFGLSDTWRHLNPAVSDRFSWFDYRSKGFDSEPKRGLRIDHIWVTPPLLRALKESDIDYVCRGMDRPSDHCPIWSEFGK